jgi:hypothetical protein
MREYVSLEPVFAGETVRAEASTGGATDAGAGCGTTIGIPIARSAASGSPPAPSAGSASSADGSSSMPEGFGSWMFSSHDALNDPEREARRLAKTSPQGAAGRG